MVDLQSILLFSVICDLILCPENTTTSATSEEDESTTDPNDHIGLIRPTKDLSIWIDEDQVNENFKVSHEFFGANTYNLKIKEFTG